MLLSAEKRTVLSQSFECSDLGNNLCRSAVMAKVTIWSQASLKGHLPFALGCLGDHSGLQVGLE